MAPAGEQIPGPVSDKLQMGASSLIFSGAAPTELAEIFALPCDVSWPVIGRASIPASRFSRLWQRLSGASPSYRLKIERQDGLGPMATAQKIVRRIAEVYKNMLFHCSVSNSEHLNGLQG